MTFGVVLWLIYLILYLLAPDQSDIYHLSYAAFFLLKLTVALPILAIWLIALFGAGQFRRYADLIRESPDGKALLTVANGLMMVVAGFILPMLVGSALPYVAGTSWVKSVVFLHSHLAVGMSLIGFGVIFVGARRLAKTAGFSLSLEYSLGLLMPYIVLAALFGWYFYRHFEVVVSNGVPNFSTGVDVAFWSIAVPSIATWLIGVLAASNIYEYANHVPGEIYRRALRDLARGISLSIFVSIVLQLLLLGAQYFVHLSLVPLLLLVYLILFFYALSFIFIARGAQKLMRIEAAT